MDRQERLRRRLESEREVLVAEVEQRVGSRFDEDQGSVDSNIEIGDRAVSLHGQDVDLGVLERRRARLSEVERALARLHRGTYGECEECGEPIDEERLAILPFALLCIECQRRAEVEARPLEESGSGFRSGFEDLRSEGEEDEDED